MAGLRAASQPGGASAPAASPSFRTTQSGRGRADGRAAHRPRPRPGRRGSPGGAAPGRPRRRPRVPRGPSCCTRSRPPPPWPRPRGIQRAGGQRSDAGRAQHRGPAGPERARGPPHWGSRGPRPGRTLMPRGRSGNGGGLRAGPGVSEARPGPGRSSWPGPPPAEGSLGEAASALPG